MSDHITARIHVTGLHHWPDAPERRSYLRYPHRHRFGIAVTVGVEHDGRQVEFHDLGEVVDGLVRDRWPQWWPGAPMLDFGPCSCERIARVIAETLVVRGYRVVVVVVDEDGENEAAHRC